MKEQIDVPRTILLILNKTAKVHTSFAVNYLYVLHNMTLTTEDVMDLSKIEIVNIMTIYSKLISACSSSTTPSK